MSNINFHSKLVKNTVDLKDNRFPKVDDARKETDKAYLELIRSRRKL